MLDADICIAIINTRSPSALRRIKAANPGEIGISSVALAELEFGVALSVRVSENRVALSHFAAPLEVAPFDRDAARVYGEVRATLQKRGAPIGPLDTLIAAHAIALGVTLVTNNGKEFTRVPALRTENWIDGRR